MLARLSEQKLGKLAVLTHIRLGAQPGTGRLCRGVLQPVVDGTGLVKYNFVGVGSIYPDISLSPLINKAVLKNISTLHNSVNSILLNLLVEISHLALTIDCKTPRYGSVWIRGEAVEVQEKDCSKDLIRSLGIRYFSSV